MRSNLVRAWSHNSFVPRPLSIVERLDIPRYEEFFGDFTAGARRPAGEPQKFQSNWHIDCIVHHLMAGAARRNKRPRPVSFSLPPPPLKSPRGHLILPAW